MADAFGPGVCLSTPKQSRRAPVLAVLVIALLIAAAVLASCLVLMQPTGSAPSKDADINKSSISIPVAVHDLTA